MTTAILVIMVVSILILVGACVNESGDKEEAAAKAKAYQEMPGHSVQAAKPAPKNAKSKPLLEITDFEAPPPKKKRMHVNLAAFNHLGPGIYRIENKNKDQRFYVIRNHAGKTAVVPPNLFKVFDDAQHVKPLESGLLKDVLL